MANIENTATVNIEPSIALKLLRQAWENDILADVDTFNEMVEELLRGKQYFTADEIITGLTQYLT